MRKILIYSSLPPPITGSNLLTSYLLQCKSKNLMFSVINTRVSNNAEEIGIFSFAKILKVLINSVKLVMKLSKFKYDFIIIVPAFTLIPFLKDSVGIILSNIFKVKCVLWINSNNFSVFYKNSIWPLKLYIGYVMNSAFIIVSTGNSINRTFDIAKIKSKRTIIYNAVPDINSTANKDIVLIKNKLRVVWLSNFIRSKGWIILFNAALNLTKTHSVEFIFAGSPVADSSEQFIKSIFSTDSSELIRYIGPIYGAEKDQLMSSADIFCLPTSYPIEALPVSILEAMSCGVPIISTNAGAILEAVDDGVNGFVVDQNNLQDLEGKLKILIENQYLREFMGKNSRKIYEEKFNLDVFYRQWNYLLGDAE